MTVLRNDAAAIDGLLRRTCDEALRFLAGLSERPVNRAHDFGSAPALPRTGIGATAALTRLMETYGDAMTAAPETIAPTASLAELRALLDRGLTAIVADAQGFHGLITRYDLLIHLRKTLN